MFLDAEVVALEIDNQKHVTLNPFSYLKHFLINDQFYNWPSLHNFLNGIDDRFNYISVVHLVVVVAQVHFPSFLHFSLNSTLTDSNSHVLES